MPDRNGLSSSRLLRTRARSRDDPYVKQLQCRHAGCGRGGFRRVAMRRAMPGPVSLRTARLARAPAWKRRDSQDGGAVYLDPVHPIEQRVKDSIGRMTLEEKVLLRLSQRARNRTPANPSVGRLESVPPWRVVENADNAFSCAHRHGRNVGPEVDPRGK